MKNNTNNTTKNNISKEMIYHKFYDYYSDNDNKELNYSIYDVREVYYPYYSITVLYQKNEKKEIHPIYISILSMIEELGSFRDINILDTLKEITCLDDDIFNSILSDLNMSGYIDLKNLSITEKGKKIKNNAFENIVENNTAYVQIDGITEEGISVNFDRKYDTKSFPEQDKYELKPKLLVYPRTETLLENITEIKTVYKVLYETIYKADNKIVNISEIKITKKFFEKYYCIFYTNDNRDEKRLIINNNYIEDEENTEKFNKIINKMEISNKKSADYQEHEKIKKEYNINTNFDEIEDGKLINASEHPKYFKYILEKASKIIYIQSPWIKYEVLKLYEEKIEDALKRNIKIIISYGMKKRNRNDKNSIDKDSKNKLDELQKKYKDLLILKEDHNHSKILICDESFAIIGSFNWLSYSGGDSRGETSTINKNINTINDLVRNKFQC